MPSYYATYMMACSLPLIAENPIKCRIQELNHTMPKNQKLSRSSNDVIGNCLIAELHRQRDDQQKAIDANDATKTCEAQMFVTKIEIALQELSELQA